MKKILSLLLLFTLMIGAVGCNSDKSKLKKESEEATKESPEDVSQFEGDVTVNSNDFDEGLRLGHSTGKPVLLVFNGYGCVNCHKMESAIWTDPEIKKILNDEFIIVELMVDDKTPLPEPMVVTDKNGEQVKLQTVGEKWCWLEGNKYGSYAQPLHVIVDANGTPIADSFYYSEDIPEYKKFLKEGIANNKNSLDKFLNG